MFMWYVPAYVFEFIRTMKAELLFQQFLQKFRTAILTLLLRYSVAAAMAREEIGEVLYNLCFCLQRHQGEARAMPGSA